MFYLTNDAYDQAVYFEVRGTKPRRLKGEIEHVIFGLLGNGITEVPVTVRNRRDSQEVIFGRDDLFTVVEERTIRRMLGEAVREMALH